jgi:hypothetical protein
MAAPERLSFESERRYETEIRVIRAETGVTEPVPGLVT